MFQGGFMLNMSQGSFRKNWLLVIVLLPLIMFSQVDAQSRRGDINPLEVSLNIPGGRSMQFSSSAFKVSNGIELVASYRPGRFFSLTGVFTHYANARIGNYEKEKTKLGFGFAVITPWQKLYSRHRHLGFIHYRAKISAIYDLTGMSVNMEEDDSSLGRWRESRIIAGLEFGAKAGQGMIFMGFHYFRSMNSFSGGSVNTDNNDHLVFNVGITVF